MNSLINRFTQTFIVQDRWKFFMDGLMMTLLLTFASFIGGTIFGAILCGLRLVKNKAVNKITNAIVQLMIQIPTLVLLMVFVYILFGNSPLSVVLVVIFGLMLKCGAYMSDIFYTAISNLDGGQAEAARTLGMTAFQAFLHVTFPQALESMIPLYQNQFVITLQETSIVGTLAVQDITKSSSIVTARTLDAFFGVIFIAVVYLIIGFICTRLLGLLRCRKHLGGIEDD